VDALGQEAEEGRGKRRYASGSCNRALIRRFPNGVTRCGLYATALPAEHIGGVEGRRGTETSKYPDEKKVITIPQVAASERGGA